MAMGGLLCLLLFYLSISDVLGSAVLVKNHILPSLRPEVKVGAKYIQLIDSNRLDPFTNGTKHRKIMASLFFPLSSSRNCQAQTPLASRQKTTLLPYSPRKLLSSTENNLYPTAFPQQSSKDCVLSAVWRMQCPKRLPLTH